MTSAFWFEAGLLAMALAALGVWAGVVVVRRTGRARRRSARWEAFVASCPSCDPSPGAAVFALSAPPGPAGDLSVEPGGLCVRLAAYPARTFWLAWASIYSLDPGAAGGALLRVAGGVEMHLSAEACRAVWEAKAHIGRPPPAQPAGLAVTAS